jgi:type IV pilus assembly protein PilA
MIRINERLRRMREEDGFTLIELMVVVLIIAILIAIAIPTFLGARKRAQDRAAQSSLRNTVTAAKAIFTDKETYTGVTATDLAEGEPAIEYLSAPNVPLTISDDPVEVVMLTAAGDRFVAVAYSKAGNCWYAQDVTGPTNAANAGTRWAMEDNIPSTGCTGANAPAVGATGAGGWHRNPADAADNPI